jgi:hypothetical protein
MVGDKPNITEEDDISQGGQTEAGMRDPLLEEYERFSDLTVWDRTEIIVDGDTRYFIAWLHSTDGVEEMITIMRSMCSNLRCFFQAACEVQSLGENKMGKLHAWLEARICIGTGSVPSGCFTLRLDPGSREENTVTTSIISPEGDEIGVCVFQI